MTKFEMSAPLAPQVPPLESGFSKLALAFGRMTGGLVVNGRALDISNDALSLMALQIICVEAGMDTIVMGASPANDEQSAFVAMADGSVWRIRCVANEGRLEASGRRVDSAECTADCVAVAAFGEAIKGLAATEVVRQGKMQDGDEILGFVNTDANAAIRMKAKGHGRFVIQQTESGAARGGVRFEIDAPPNCNMDEALQCLKMADLTPAEVEVERENIKRQLGVVENPFPTKMGLA